MTSQAQTTETVQIHRVYIKATPQAIWDAITKPEWTRKYGYTGLAEFDLRAGAQWRTLATPEMLEMGTTEVLTDGEVIEVDPPRKLVLTWRMVMEPTVLAEGFTRLTYEIEETKAAGTRLTVTHDLTGAPNLYAMVAGQYEDIDNQQSAGGGWNWVLSDLKTLLETGDTIVSH
jgi:uncharacterized protein YndB with AHSA1/START domain